MAAGKPGLAMKQVLVWRLLVSTSLLMVFLFLSQGLAWAGVLGDRVAEFPHWQGKPTVQMATRELTYPQWMAGTWTVTSTLIDLAAPLAPNLTTPGFEGNRQFLNQPITFQVRFIPKSPPVPAWGAIPFGQRQVMGPREIVADRAFNGLNLATAYLGSDGVLSVTVDPHQPNRQITRLPRGRSLVSVVTGQASEFLQPDRFIATELCQQLFQGAATPYFNEVETTTVYEHFPGREQPIQADQITAIYLSPQDPNYFAAGTTPVALYRYRLVFMPLEKASPRQNGV
ncbi:MAG: hypothetical protein NZ772_09865 [Cyanobacteria bacterium]|nr:hypothetical protein [Cyanobacteriota bacterium]MDW8201800.1 hypothetical protein [Cyanobacteriota bacterium SKYGB_h_bin112]